MQNPEFLSVLALVDEIHQKDCLEGLQSIADNTVDAIITDPPYWLGSRLHIDKHGQYVGHLTDCKHTGSTWKVGDGYWVETLMKEYHRVLKHGGFAITFSIDRLVDLPMYNARRAGFDICQSLYWEFKQGIPKGTKSRQRAEALIFQGNAGTRMLRKQEYDNPTGEEIEVKSGSNGFVNNIQTKKKKDGTKPLTEIGKKVEGTTYGLACLAPEREVICVFRKPHKYKNIAEDIVKSQEDSEVRPAVVDVESAKKETGIFPSQVLRIPKPNKSERCGHPTQKPVKLMERLVRLFTQEEEVVLDPFCGSGTTCIACRNNNRRYIGFENDPEHVRMANERLKLVVTT